MLTGSFLPKVGGMEYVIHYLSEALSELGHEVVIFSHKRCGKVNFSSNYTIVNYGSKLPFSGRSGFDTFDCTRKFGQYIRDNKVDLLHCHSAAVGDRAIRINNKFGVPVVMTPHGEDVQKFPEIGYGIRLKPGWDDNIRSNLLQADIVTTISESIEMDVSFVPSERIVRIPNGVKIDGFAGPEAFFLHDTYGLQKSCKIILSVGRNHVKKGYKVGIEAFARSGVFREQNVKYILIGRGVEELKSHVDQLGMSDYVFLMSEIAPDKMSECYRSSYLFFSPSTTEGLSMVSIEAMAAGLPIIATDVPGNRDIIIENDCGVLVPCNDQQAMGDAIKEMVTDVELRDSYAEKSRQRSFRYDWQNVSKEYETVFLNLVKNFDEKQPK